MEDIVFEFNKERLAISVSNELSNINFLSRIKERLEKLMIIKDAINKNVILDLRDRVLNDKEVIQLFDILESTKLFYFKKIIYKNISKNNLAIYKGDLRGGQIRFFDKSLLYIGNINKDSKLVVYGDLYVLGKVKGEIELKDSSSLVYVQEIENSFVKIANISKYYSGSFKNKKIVLCNNKIEESDYIKEEISNVKSSSCYFW